MTIKLELQAHGGRHGLKTIEVRRIPKSGEMFEPGEKGTFEVVEVVHTPLIREYDAIVILKRLKI